MYYMPQYAAEPQLEYLPQPEYMPQYSTMPQQNIYPQQQEGYPVYPQQDVYQQNNAFAQPYAYMPQAMDYAPQYSAVAFAGWDGFEEAQWAPPAEDAVSMEEAQAVAMEAVKPPDTKAKKALKTVSVIFFWVICVVLLVGSVAFTVSRDPRKDIFGFRTYSVKTESMTPKADGSSLPGGFRAGDMIIVQTTAPEEIEVGDIITFNPSVREEDNRLFLTHRVVDILQEMGGKPGIYFVTKGDHNNSEDPPISSEMLIGKKVYSIPKVGVALQKVQENFALAITTILCFFACIFMLRWFFSAPKKPKQRKKA